MAYATQADLERRFGAAEVADAGRRDPERIARALEDASAEIDAYLGRRYALPLSSVPAVIARIACDIARYRLWDDQAPDEVRRRYEDALRFLERVARGEVEIGVPEPAADPAAAPAYRSPPPVMRDLDY